MSYEREKISYTIGMRIREFRTERNLSQEALALSSGLHPAYLGRIERGEKCPTVDTLYKIASGLSLPLAQLMDLTFDSKPTHAEAMRRIESAMNSLSDEEASSVADIIDSIIQLTKKNHI